MQWYEVELLKENGQADELNDMPGNDIDPDKDRPAETGSRIRQQKRGKEESRKR